MKRTWWPIGLAWAFAPAAYLLTSDVIVSLLGTAGLLTIVAIGENERRARLEADDR